jgi:hypothetical protein
MDEIVKPLLFPSSRRGVAATIRKGPVPKLEQTGWSKSFLTTPSAPRFGCLRRYFLEVASSPPPEEGNSSIPDRFNRVTDRNYTTNIATAAINIAAAATLTTNFAVVELG